MDHDFSDVPFTIEDDRLRTMDRLQKLQASNAAWEIAGAVGFLALIYIVSMFLYILFPGHVGVN